MCVSKCVYLLWDLCHFLSGRERDEERRGRRSDVAADG